MINNIEFTHFSSSTRKRSFSASKADSSLMQAVCRSVSISRDLDEEAIEAITIYFCGKIQFSKIKI
jgi:hypothetical protein